MKKSNMSRKLLIKLWQATNRKFSTHNTNSETKEQSKKTAGVYHAPAVFLCQMENSN